MSGSSALIFEIVWFKHLGLLFGTGVWSAAIVMAIFMAGLAAGSALAAGKSLARFEPMKAFAILSMAISLSGAALVIILPILPHFFAPAFGRMMDAPWLINFSRATISLFLLIMPTCAMGATLPLLVRSLESCGPGFGKILGKLYGSNTVGAVFGCVIADLLLVQKFGLKGAGIIASIGSLAAGIAAWTLSTRAIFKKNLSARNFILDKTIPLSARVILISSFLSGFILLALEVLWLRVELLFVNGTIMAFAALLACVLSGMGFGGLAACRWFEKDRCAHRYSGVIACGCGISALVCFSNFMPALGFYNWHARSQFFSILPLALAIVFLPSFFSGILFTFLGAALDSRIKQGQRSAGLLAFFNTAGAMAGALAGGFFLLPRYGIEASILILSSLYVVITLFLIGATESSSRAKIAVFASAIAFIIVFSMFPFGIVRDRYGVYSAREYKKTGEDVIAYREGLAENIVYTQKKIYGQNYYHRLVTNSYSMSSTTPVARRYMKLFVYLPAALHHDIKDALLISYGAGSTAKALVDTKDIKKIDIVDISRDIIEMGCVSFSDDPCPLNDPRVAVHIEDGRHFLLAANRRYDLITAEPPPPKNAGISNLYSMEYFGLMRERLKDGGMATYWLPVAQLEERETKAIIRAFCSAFADCSLWAPSGADWMLLGSKNARNSASAESFKRQWDDPKTGCEIRGLGFETPAQMGALFLADAQTLIEMTRGILPLSDDRPYVISSAPANTVKMFSLYAKWMDSKNAMKRFEKSALIEILWPATIRRESASYFKFQEILNKYLTGRAPNLFVKLKDLHFILTESNLEVPALWIMDSDADIQKIAGLARDRGEIDSAVLHHLGAGSLSRRDYASAARYFGDAMRMDTRGDFKFLDTYRNFALCMGSGRKNQACAQP